MSFDCLTLEASMLLHYSIHIFTYRFSVFLCISAFLVIQLQKMSIEVTLYIHIFLKKIYMYFSVTTVSLSGCKILILFVVVFFLLFLLLLILVDFIPFG